jgi:hypothetical protein
MNPARRNTLLAFSALLIAGLLGMWMWSARAAEEEAQREEAAREATAQRARDRQREESQSLMPEPVENLWLGMTVEEVRAAGHDVQVPQGRPTDERMNLRLFEERLENGAQIMFGFSQTTGHLQQIQLMSLLPQLDAIPVHLSAMNERYGNPSGIWDCPDTEGLPTRRFTWRHSHTAIADVFLVYNNRASLTLYIATPDTIMRSLRMSQCAPVPRERLDQFPTATPEQIQRVTAGQ